MNCPSLESVVIPSSVTNILDERGAFEKCEKVKIYTPKGSYAEKYAKEHGIKCAIIGEKKHIEYESGNKYDGEVMNGKRHGRGVFTWANGDKYEGDFVEGKRTGRGVYIWKNGDKYEGEFVGGKEHGHGVYTYANGEKYEGEWKNGVRQKAEL
jgi:hypothetical protein